MVKVNLSIKMVNQKKVYGKMVFLWDNNELKKFSINFYFFLIYY